MKTGRPTEYSPTILKRAQAYFTKKLSSDEVVHSIEGLALVLGVSRDTIYEWEKEEGKEEFSDIVKQIRTKKSFRLQNGSLKGELNAPIAKLLLGHEGYREAQDITTDGKGLTVSLVSYGDPTPAPIQSETVSTSTTEGAG